jgi:hypothetical protein
MKYERVRCINCDWKMPKEAQVRSTCDVFSLGAGIPPNLVNCAFVIQLESAYSPKARTSIIRSAHE